MRRRKCSFTTSNPEDRHKKKLVGWVGGVVLTLQVEETPPLSLRCPFSQHWAH